MDQKTIEKRNISNWRRNKTAQTLFIDHLSAAMRLEKERDRYLII
jgi:hypothetical protein